MKQIMPLLIVGLLLIGVNVFAQGDLIVNGKIGAGISSPAYSLTVEGINGDGLAVVDSSGNLRTLFDRNVSGAGRFRLYDLDGIPRLNFVAGGAGTFDATGVYFRDLSSVLMLNMNADTSTIEVHTCLMIRDTDDAGWTECNTLDGAMSCSIDTDGKCDGQ